MNELDPLLYELKQIKKLVALSALKDLESKQDKIWTLFEMGFDTKSISEIVQVKPNSVLAAISNIKKKIQKTQGGGSNG